MDERPQQGIESLRDADILCIASANWDAALWTNSQHLMSRLARTNRVLFVESLGLRRPSVRWRDVYRVAGRLWNWARGERPVSGNLTVYSPLLIPLYNLPWVRELNFWLLRNSLSRVARKRGFRRMILWTFLPTSSDLVGHLGESLSVYHCVDEYGANPGVSAGVIQDMERKLLGKADLVFTTSPSLFEGKRRYNPNTHYLPNVADAEHFRKAMIEETPVPAEAAALRRPVIGFVGALSGYKIDFPLLLHLADARPDWTIALVGPVWPGERRRELEELRRRPNVRLFGARPYAELPGWIKAMDVCIIPFAINETTVNVFPMKFHEYMATGKPIVMTDLPSVTEYRDYCRLASSPEEFVRAVEAALEDDGRGVEERLRVARRNTWETRIERIEEIVEAYGRSDPFPPKRAVPRGRIGIDARKIHDYGIGTYIRNLVWELSRLDREREYVVFSYPEENLSWGENIRTEPDRSPKYSIREHISLSRKMRRHRIDLFHSPHYVLPLFHPCSAVVTVHDLIHIFHPPSRAAAAYARAMMTAAVRSASRVITVSEASRDDLVRRLRVDEKKVKVIYNAVEDRFHPIDGEAAREEVARRIGVEGEYVLCVSNFLPHKNLNRLIRAFGLLRKEGYEGRLVLAGGDPERAPDLIRETERLGLEGEVLFPGFLPADFLPSLYNAARLFVFPSLYEGFGLPPLEAMACGVPVVVSATRAIEEVVADAGVRVDPESEREIADGMLRLLGDDDLHRRYAAAALRRAGRYSWRRTAELTLDVYREVLSHG
ncbi:MAG: glycosyltransferase [Candidatus Eisenbacteria bacterium]|nr:glycosyltransferase [Candidatus Eisenbacteria bacterium]